MSQQPSKKQQTYQGIVVSSKADKTVVVRVERVVTHPIYKKQYKQSKKFKVHDPKNQYKAGDTIEFQNCRPISKDKHWIVLYT